MSHILVLNFGSSKTPLIAEMVRACGRECSVVKWDEVKEDELKRSAGIIFSGSPTMFTEVSHAPYLQKFSFIKEGKIPTLGICFGHQLMGILHGSAIFRAEEIRDWNKIHVVKEDVLFEGLSPETTMKEDHTEGITLPPGFIHLARSVSYINEGMRHPNLPLWGVQFHPEVSEANGKKMIGNFLKQV
ncbi:MAG TPA: gamma-glutamyl-gamma-aminobutyrate hydrolase family protein [Bacteroidia bacterium]|jgi:GMP synthase (glutamine-hydrolysing)|nr:gamma-glutamyl-gamma-aminobutyrate hydrolase family protein [Bacteroidia bacterium]